VLQALLVLQVVQEPLGLLGQLEAQDQTEQLAPLVQLGLLGQLEAQDHKEAQEPLAQPE
jgi:hypothetical protein